MARSRDSIHFTMHQVGFICTIIQLCLNSAFRSIVASSEWSSTIASAGLYHKKQIRMSLFLTCIVGTPQ